METTTTKQGKLNTQETKQRINMQPNNTSQISENRTNKYVNKA